ncbi:MAG TPA: 3'(2'),5'-bisphosphate nucleotidase CysQ [Ilumatobacteraceae bacterium]|nr:3'(2'),5'-bisphosphate nucleotidase CysQ [Ilumatobacteraceae bacterium]
MNPTPADHVAARQMATRAGALLLELRANGSTGRELSDVGDAESQRWLAQALTEQFPDDAVLSEEANDTAARLQAGRVWIIDPLDGSREYGELDRSDWAVHVALAIDEIPVAGAVALPALGVTLATDEPPEVPSALSGGPRILVSRTRPTAHAQRLADLLGGTLVPMGSAGAKAMAVVRGEGDIYAHSGGQYEWDSAAPVAVAAAAGLHVSRLDGSALRYNQPNPYLPDLLICRPEWVTRVIEALR